MSCGYGNFIEKIYTNGFLTQDLEEMKNLTISSNNISEEDLTEVELYTSYLGKVKLKAILKNDNVILENFQVINDQKIGVKVIDSEENGISVEKRYNLNKLINMKTSIINIEKNKYYYVLSLLSRKKLAQLTNNTDLVEKISKELNCFSQEIEKAKQNYPELVSENPTKSLKDYKKLYQQISIYNCGVDVLFCTSEYLLFLYKYTGIVSVNNLETIVSIIKIPDLDNAFFTGEYCAYGCGDKMFYPLTSLDVIGHELSHGLVHGTSNLVYKGHSGALNESFSDIFGAMFEFYLYDKYKDLKGVSDWQIGEDLGMKNPYLRNMENPEECNQPKIFRGKYYLNPYSSTDHGGVHINSGIPNYCFYLACQKKKDKELVLKIFTKCLLNLSKKATFSEFRRKLIISSDNDKDIIDCLDAVGLKEQNNSNNTNFPPRHQIPQRFPQRFPQRTPQRFPQRFPQRIPQIPSIPRIPRRRKF